MAASPRTWTRRSLFASSIALAAWACSDAPRAVVAASVAAPAPATVAVVAEPAPPPLEPIRYDRDIRPILADRCFLCHGPDEKKRQGKLRLDHFEGAVADRGGYAAIAPGDAKSSEVWRRVTNHDVEERMPPATSNRRPLGESELALLRRWIDEGAQYEPHWSFVPPVRPEVPRVTDSSWPRNDVDRFVLAKLERERVAPSSTATPETLLRRVFLDLTGLPPTLEETDAFLADASSDAYERWVDKLLTQEPYVSRYAERMAVPWLDAARYADTCGIHMDAGRQIWPWRDWVLNAFRDGMPFDRFVEDQIAGDLFPGATEAQRVASGFNRNHVTSDEGGAINEEYLVEYAVDRTATTGSVFLGLTLGCARCHEHKFDPIAQEEFYDLFAYFNSVEEPGVYSQETDPKRAFEPFIEVPSDEVKSEIGALRERIKVAKAELDAPSEKEDRARDVFFAGLPALTNLAWPEARTLSAASSNGATLAIEADGSVFASGENPPTDEHTITLHTDATGLSLVSLYAIADARLPHGRVGRAENGNAVLSSISAEAISSRDPSLREPVQLAWAWADVSQEDGDFAIVNALDLDERGWAVAAHQKEGSRAALFLADRPFGFEGGTDVVVRLAYRSVYQKHVLGHVRLELGRVGPEGLAMLPTSASAWYLCGPFEGEKAKLFDASFGPESAALDLAQKFGDKAWRYDAALRDGRLNGELPKGIGVTYAARRLFAASPRTIEVALGSDDGFRLYLDGKEVAKRAVDRALAADQDRVSFEVPAGQHTLVFKVVNTGGDGGFYWKSARREGELEGALTGALLSPQARWAELDERIQRGWRFAFSAEYRARGDALAALEKDLAAREKAVPRTMVMKELAQPRDTFLLVRGQYDQPDKSRRAHRGVPAALGHLPDGAPDDRRGLAQWLVARENPLVARVAVNRMWETLFGTGLVRTSEDLGMQGEWPSHPELLDWLAVDFVESGWDVKRMWRTLVTSATYRQSSRARPDVAERDPDNRWLSHFPRRRLGAEEIRDQALYVSGLLLERFGGPSVKPYQPDGLWQEIAMIQSNTRVYERGPMDELWRRSLYTYWKRAAPPPAMLTFDAPTREFCTVRRGATNTPLQAFVLWNDEQFVEAARVLASRTLAEPGADRERLARVFRRCTGRAPSNEEIERLDAGLQAFRARYRDALADAQALVAVGESPLPPEAEVPELAAWTMIANAMLNLDATICRG
jgi:hypothetical protein